MGLPRIAFQLQRVKRRKNEKTDIQSGSRHPLEGTHRYRLDQAETLRPQMETTPILPVSDDEQGRRRGGLNMDRFEALTEAMNRCVASIEQLANAIRQSETRCGYIKQKHNRPVYRKGAKLHEGFKRITRTREGFRK